MSHALAPLALLLALLGQGDIPVGIGPQPALHPVSWELEFKFLDPQRIEVKLPGADQPEVFWYMVYTVTNPSPRSQRFFPLFQIVTEDLKVHDTDMGISPLVFDAIQERHKLTHPYLTEPTRVIGALLSGDDNARESVAVWRRVDLTSNSFTVYVAGLSGEIALVPNRNFNPDRPETGSATAAGGSAKGTDNPKNFTLRKTLEIRYTLPGSPQARPSVWPERGKTRWIMR